MDSEIVVDILRQIFARFGLLEQIVSDNDTQFTSPEFEKLCTINSIQRITSPPYHPATNGAAENAVESFKNAMLKALKDPQNSHISIDTLVSRYLMSYRSTSH